MLREGDIVKERQDFGGYRRLGIIISIHDSSLRVCRARVLWETGDIDWLSSPWSVGVIFSGESEGVISEAG